MILIMKRFTLLLALWVSMLAFACGDVHEAPEPPTPQKVKMMPLLLHEQWQVNGYICPPSGWREESDSLFVDTGICDPFEGQQPLIVDLERGDEVGIDLWHLNLTAPEPAQARVLLKLGEHVVWSQTIDIPSPGQSYLVRWSPPETIPAGTLWSLSIANHGGNHWRMKTIRLVECGGCRD